MVGIRQFQSIADLDVVVLKVLCWVIRRIGNFLKRTQTPGRITMAFRTPFHSPISRCPDPVHPGNVIVTFRTSHTARHVGNMAEIGVPGKAVHRHPGNRHARIFRIIGIRRPADRFNQRAVGQNVPMTIHAGRRRWESCLGRNKRAGMVGGTIHTQLAHMRLVRKLHRLLGCIRCRIKILHVNAGNNDSYRNGRPQRRQADAPPKIGKVGRRHEERGIKVLENRKNGLSPSRYWYFSRR